MRGVELVQMYSAFVQELRKNLKNHGGPHRRDREKRLRVLLRLLERAHDQVRAEKRLARRQITRAMRRLRR